jgi:hypothetical protein
MQGAGASLLEGGPVIEVAIEVYADDRWQEVNAEVTKLAPDDYVVIWTDLPAVLALGFTGARLYYMTKRCEEQYRFLEWEREAEGISDLLDDVAPVTSCDRDNRIAEVA